MASTTTSEITRRHQPELTTDSLLVLQRRYLEAWRDAGQIMVDAMRTVMQRQAELTEEGMREFWAGREAALQAGSGDYRPGEQLERLHGYYQRAFGGLQEATEIMFKAQSEAMRVLTDSALARTAESRKAA